MEQSDGNEATNEFEILQMVGIHVAGWVDLKAIVIFIGIFEETVHWIEHFMRQQKEPFTGNATII